MKPIILFSRIMPGKTCTFNRHNSRSDRNAILYFPAIHILVFLLLVCFVTLKVNAQGPYNVQTYGAQADGSHDDGPAILLAIAAAHNYSITNGNVVVTVQFPASSHPYLIGGSMATINPEGPNRSRNYMFPIYSNMIFEGASTSGSVLKFKDDLFNEKTTGDLTAGTGKYFNCNMFYGSPSNNVSNVVFKDFSIDFNGAANQLPPGQDLQDNLSTGVRKTIYGILIDGGSTSGRVTIESVNFYDNPGVNDVIVYATGDSLVIKDCVFRNGGRNIGTDEKQNKNHYDFSFIYSDWTNTLITNNSIVQEYPEISLQGVSNSGGIEIHASDATITNNYIYACKPAIYLTSSGTLGKTLDDILIKGNTIEDCSKGIFFWTINHINRVMIDSNYISLMFIKENNSLDTVQILDGRGELAGIFCDRGDQPCRKNFDYDISPTNSENPGNLNLNTLRNIVIRRNTITYDLTNSLSPTDRYFTTAGVQVHSFHDSRIDSNVITNMNYAGVCLKGSPWGTKNLSIKANDISNFQYSVNIPSVNTNWGAFIVVSDYYQPNNDCGPYHSATYSNVKVLNNTFQGNTVTVTRAASCSTSNGYNCFKNMYFDLPRWYGFTANPASPYSTNILNPNAFIIQSGDTYANYFNSSPCDYFSTCTNNGPATDIKWFSIMSNADNTFEVPVELSGGGCLSPSDYSGFCKVGYRLVAVGGANHKWDIVYNKPSSPSFLSSTKYGSQIILTRGIDYPMSNVASSEIVATVSSRAQNDDPIASSNYSETRNVSCIDPACTPPACAYDLSITGLYSIPLTQCSTWIRSNNITIIKGTANVRLDPDPAIGDVLMEPINDDYFLAAPANEAAVFIAVPKDGCGAGIPRQLPVIKSPKFVVYPNPAFGSFTVQSEIVLNGNSIQLFNANGARQRIATHNTAYNTVLVTYSNLGKGVYFLKINEKGQLRIARLVIF